MTGGEAAIRDYGELTGEQQARLDRAAGDLGISVVQLMEVAGWQVARWIYESLDGAPAPILVVAGSGNNGGDGLVAARHLSTWGFPVAVALVAEPERLAGIPADQLGVARAVGVPIHAFPDGAVPTAATDGAALIVDALLGTGVRGNPRSSHAEAISRLPAGRTVAIDVPSGLDATSGVPGIPTARAVRTCTLTAMKAGLWSAAGRDHAGELTVADIGMPDAAWTAIGLSPPALVRGGRLLPVPASC
jgi:ADP-dependent NAD(P)H-hydrate dehydratase / NAD(P)H-hydrate epimerase